MTQTRKPIRDLFRTDPALEINGVTLDFGDYGSFVVARNGGANKAARAVSERIFRPYRQAAALGALDPKTEAELTARAVAEGLVKGWDLVDENGEQLPFTAEACTQLFVEMPDLLEHIISESQKLQNYAAVRRTDEGKA